MFADDCSLLASGTDPAETVQQLNRDLERISSWADRWKITLNAGKTKDIIFTNKVLNNSPPLLFKDTVIDRINTHRHLGVYLTSTLDWSFHVNDICLKANRKLAVLRNVKCLKRGTLDLLYKVTVRSVIDYSLPVYGNNLKQTDIARLERLQYRAAKLVTGALHYTSREKLNNELGWESIQKRMQFLGLCIFHKIHLQETRPLVRKCLYKLDYEKKQLTRSKGGYKPYDNFGVKFQNSFFPYISKLWNNLKTSTQSLALPDFKDKLKIDMKPNKIKHFSKGSKTGNKLMTRIRMDRSDLNLHKFVIGLSDNPICMCHAKQESSLHFMIDCFLYSVERQTLFGLVEQYVPKFNTLGKFKKYETLIMGVNIDNPDYYHTNMNIMFAVHNFITKTKRFFDK